MFHKPLHSLVTASTIGLGTMAAIGHNVLAEPARNFTIRNNTGQTIVYVYVTSSAENSWGSDRIPNFTLPQGQSYTVRLRGGCLYDIKVTLANNQQIEQRQVDTCSSRNVALRSIPVDNSTPGNNSSGTNTPGNTPPSNNPANNGANPNPSLPEL